MPRRIAMRAIALLATLGLSTLSAASDAGEPGWSDNMDQALKTATSEGKHLLIDFTGSDWCGWCIKLNDDVFSQEEFKEHAPKTFVLVKLDFPRDKSKLSEETIAQNEKWREKLAVRSFPSIFLATADGTAYARTGYREGTPSDYVTHLIELRTAKKASDTALADAASATGAQKAKLLDGVLANSEIIVKSRAQIVDEIIDLDANNALGLKGKYEEIRRQSQIVAEATHLIDLWRRGKTKEALGGLSAMITKYELEGEEAQKIMEVKIRLLARSRRLQEALAVVDATIDLSPDSKTAEAVQRFRPRLEAEILAQQKILKEVKKATDPGPSKENASDSSKQTASETKP